MAKSQRIICQYCQTSNPLENTTCLACGGPLASPEANLKSQDLKNKISQKVQQPQTVDLKKATENVDDVYFTILNTYTFAWRTVGEAISIALTGFILGFIGGATGAIVPGILGAILVGLAVGFTRKQFYLVLISTPAGLLLGIGLGVLIWALGNKPQVMVYTGMLFAVIGAVFGGHHGLPYRHRNCWEKTRPFLGAFGGFFFGILGVLLGWLIRSGIHHFLAI